MEAVEDTRSLHSAWLRLRCGRDDKGVGEVPPLCFAAGGSGRDRPRYTKLSCRQYVISEPLTYFFAPVLEGLLYYSHELVGYGAVYEAVIVTKG